MAKPVRVEASIRDRMTSRLQRMDRQVNRFGRTWERSSRMAARGARLMGRGMSILDRSLYRLWRRARLAMLMLQVMASVMGGMAVNAAFKYERSLRQVFTLMRDAGSQTAEFQQRFVNMDAALRTVARRTKSSMQGLAEGLYEVVSTGFEAETGLQVLEAAAKGAYAGATDVDTATALLTQTLQAFRKEGETTADMAGRATGMMDMFFNAVNVGVFTFEELAMKFGDVASTASAFGVKLEDLLAFLSTATVRGVGLDEAITSARQTLLAIADTTPATEKALVKLFGSSEKVKESFSAQALAEKGLIGVMTELSAVIGTKIDKSIVEMATAMEEEGGDAAGFLAEKIGITVEALTALFPNIRALKGVLAVTGPGLEVYASHYEEIANNMGAVDRAAQEIDKSASGALQGLKVAWEQFKLDVGGIALPWIKEVADAVVLWWGGIPERFATETGQISPLPGLSPEDELRRAELIGQIWARADPGERIGFVLRTAWSDALDNLSAWFDGGGREKINEVANKVGTAIGQALSGAFGLQTEDVKDNIFYQMGASAAEGFAAGFSANFSLGDAVGSVVEGRGVLGQLAQWYLLLKGGKWLLGKFGAGAAAGGGGAAGAGAGAAAGGGGATAAAAKGGFFSRLWKGIGAALAIGAAEELGLGPQHPGVGGSGPMGWLWNLISPPPSRAQPSQRFLDVNMGAGAPGGLAAEGASQRLSAAADDQMTSSSMLMLAAARLNMSASYLSSLRIPGLSGGGGTAPSRASGFRLGGVTESALGFSGVVNKATLFMAGEAGTEDVEVTPHRGGVDGRGGRRGFTVAGPLIGHVTVTSDYDVDKLVAALNHKLEKAFANG